MSELSITLSSILTLTATNAWAADSGAYNFSPLIILLVANLVIGGMLLVGALGLFSVWRERRLAYQRKRTHRSADPQWRR